MVELLRRGPVLALLALLLGCGAAPPSPETSEAPLFPRYVLEEATQEFAKAYQSWAARQQGEPPAVELERLLNMTGRGGSVVEAENTILGELAVLDVPVLTGKPGEVAPEVVTTLRVEATETVLRSGDMEAVKTTIYFKLYDPHGLIVVSHAYKTMTTREP